MERDVGVVEGPEPDVRPRGLPEAQALVAAEMARRGVPGLSAAVFRGDRLLYGAGFGLGSLSPAVAATPATAYLWFSMSKIATATVVMRLVDEGIVSLDDLVAERLPTFRAYAAAGQVTVRHLLSHTAGLANPVPLRWVTPVEVPAPDSSALLRRLLARHRKPKCPVGQAARYSNLGYLVLAEAGVSTAAARW